MLYGSRRRIDSPAWKEGERLAESALSSIPPAKEIGGDHYESASDAAIYDDAIIELAVDVAESIVKESPSSESTRCEGCEQLRDVVLNLLGVFDNPYCRLKFPLSTFGEEVIKDARKVRDSTPTPPAPEPQEHPIEVLWREESEFSQTTFGADNVRGPLGPLNHLAKEVKETIEHPSDPMEYADCVLLILDAARRAGFTLKQLLDTCHKKLEINKARKWGDPGEDGVVQHIREPLPVPSDQPAVAGGVFLYDGGPQTEQPTPHPTEGQEPQHVCGLRGFPESGDECPACKAGGWFSPRPQPPAIASAKGTPPTQADAKAVPDPMCECGHRKSEHHAVPGGGDDEGCYHVDGRLGSMTVCRCRNFTNKGGLTNV